MDILFKPIGHLERKLPSPLSPYFICDVPQKSDIVDCHFTHFIFGFIYRGTGFYEVDGQRYEVAAPYVITEWAGPHFHYGPDSEWSELYIRFETSSFHRLQEQSLWSPDRPAYPIAQPAKWHALHQLLQTELQPGIVHENGDTLDRLVELLILTTLPELHSPDTSALEHPQVEQIRKLEQQIRENIQDTHDWPTCAKELGMSQSSFRRYWLEVIGIPPARFLSQLRMETSANYLISTSQPIKEIAELVGFEDPLHFSRKFTQHFGTSPRNFRIKNQN